MAILWLRCVNLYTIFLLICSISNGFTSSDLDDYYRYLTYPSSSVHKDSLLSLETYGDGSSTDSHSLNKRDAPAESETPNPIDTNRSDRKTSVPKKTPSFVGQENKSPIGQKNQTDLINKPNLGVNGTGIKKDGVVKQIFLQKPLVTVKNLNTSYTDNSNNASSTVTSTTSSPVSNETTSAKTNQTKANDDEISISKFAEEDSVLNQKLKESNFTTKNDTHVYYNSTFTVDKNVGRQYWVNMVNRTDVKVNDLLSASHRRAATVKLSFDFPFYGHMVRNVTIATGGFLYTGEYVHSWLAATQYIAPLMANFDTSLSDDSFVKYFDNGTSFTVQWENVALQDKPQDGNFTFQATLHKNGDIVFVYKDVPVFIEDIKDDHHPVKVGLSDAFIIDRTVFFVRRKTIYEYHRVNFNREDIKNWTVIYLRALPTCLNMTDCDSCLSNLTDFQCTWCAKLNRCSNGVDRHRQQWLVHSCDKNQLFNKNQCKSIHLNESGENAVDDDLEQKETIMNVSRASRVANENQPVHMDLSGILTVLFLIALVAGLGVWLLYAYRNPHTTSGQILIRYRPSQWSWKRGEARYTAATIHM